ncbi:hypothetical protein H072_4763 [Dactylellina haptotyla CBS 200.50]|uniref:Uncharacterized protein n=1 Tax=Dactylellina haptotyla (strain CBS 200.50) TaxID=1284197 RepID=S8AJR3_DACHA|nr:hypothetical protein H072_4763 [Dactylellina haptotyla CBS 200.50]
MSQRTPQVHASNPSEESLQDSHLFDIVKTFNSLPRSPSLPSGLNYNIWHFSIRHIPLHPPGDILFFVNFVSQFIHIEGPIQYPTTPPTGAYLPQDIQTKAKCIAPLLLQGFNNKLDVSDPWAPAFAPWAWMTNDRELAKLVGDELKAMGVDEALCKVEVATKEQNEQAQENYCGFVGALTKSVNKGAPKP